MNYITTEQIKEYVSKHPEGIAGMSKELSEMVNHFAELIVRQMLEVTDAHTEVFQTDRDKALIEHIKQSVKQHFGVDS